MIMERTWLVNTHLYMNAYIDTCVHLQVNAPTYNVYTYLPCKMITILLPCTVQTQQNSITKEYFLKFRTTETRPHNRS